MKWLSLIMLLSLVVFSNVLLSGEELRPEERIYGLSLIWQEANYNFAFFDQVPHLDWDSTYCAFVPKVLEAETTLDYYRVLKRFVALLEDGHTSVYFPQELTQSREWSYPWVLIKRVDGKAYVRSVGESLLDQLPVGSVITHIEGESVYEYATDEIIPYVTASTEHHRLDSAYNNLLHGLSGSTVDIRFETPSGDEKSLTLTRDRWTRDDNWNPDPNISTPRMNLSWHEKDIAIMELNTFADSVLVEEWVASLPELRRAKGLIVDIRKNRGGSSNIGYQIASWLTNDSLKTSAWRTREHRASFKAWGLDEWATMDRWYDGGTHGTIPPANGDRLIIPTVVLHDHSTFSAAEDFLVAIEKIPHITTIGRPSGGSTGQPLFFELPGGGSVRICTKRDTYPDGRDFVGVGIAPDIYIEPTVEDIRIGRDVILEHAIDLLNQQIQP